MENSGVAIVDNDFHCTSCTDPTGEPTPSLATLGFAGREPIWICACGETVGITTDDFLDLQSYVRSQMSNPYREPTRAETGPLSHDGIEGLDDNNPLRGKF